MLLSMNQMLLAMHLLCHKLCTFSLFFLLSINKQKNNHPVIINSTIKGIAILPKIGKKYISRLVITIDNMTNIQAKIV